MSCNNQNFRIEAVNAFWGKRNKTCVDTESASVASLDGLYFEISDLDTDYYVWFDLDGGSTDPAVSGKTGIEVDVATGMSAKQVADAIKAAVETPISSVKKFFASVQESGCVCISVFKYGKVLNASTAGNSGLTIETLIEGLGGFLGALASDPSMSLATESTTITQHQTGNIAVDEIVTGITAEVTLSLANASDEIYELLIKGGYGGSYTPSGGTTLYGAGGASIGKGASVSAGELNLVPVKITDNSRTFTLFQSVPSVSNITYSSTEQQALEVTFKGLLNPEINKEINLYAFGDPTQDLTE